MLKKYYGTVANVTKAVDRVSFQVEHGEFVGVMGASGSGKTTLLNLLATIDRVTAGHIYYENTDITELSDDALSEFRKENLGFVFQDYNLLDTLTIEENILLAVTIQGGRKKDIQKDLWGNAGTSGTDRSEGKIPVSGFRRAETALCMCKSHGQSSQTASGG